VSWAPGTVPGALPEKNDNYHAGEQPTTCVPVQSHRCPPPQGADPGRTPFRTKRKELDAGQGYQRLVFQWEVEASQSPAGRASCRALRN
jgi:hypothetical protein